MAYERWDRDRFERERERDEFDEREYYREDDYRRPYAPAREHSRGPPVRESERIFFEDRHSSGAPAPFRPRREDFRYYDDRETVVGRGGDMVPFREREDEREVDIRFSRERDRPFQRPQFVRRQSSLDTHDRRPMPRYGDHVREEIAVPMPPRYPDRFYDDIRVAEPEYYGDEEYHPYREHETETVRRRYPPQPPPPPATSSGEEIIYERAETVRSEYPKKGKTRMPKRLINIRAIMDLGYEFEEEDKTIIVLKALGKDNIDEVIRISREYNAATMVPPPMDQPVPPPIEEDRITRRTEIIRDDPSLASSHSSSRSSSPATVVTKKSHKSRKSKATSRHSRETHRSKSTRRHRSASFSSATTGRELVVREPRHDSRHSSRRESRGAHSTELIIPRHERRSLSDELHALELERKALKYEREAAEKRHGHEYLVEKDYKDGTVEVKKERNGPNPKLLKAMMATLT